MDDFITIYYWARLAVLVLATAVALVSAVRMTARRPLRPWREIVVAALVVAAFVALSVIPGVYYGVVWAAVLVVLGLAAGWVVNRGRRATRAAGRVELRRSPLVPWLWFVAAVLTFSTLLFAETYLFSLSMLLLAFVMGAFVGQTIALLRVSVPGTAGDPAHDAGAEPSPA
ncbi:MAG: hypothetical protein V2J16_07190, partial [Thermoleophilia bacterium]|nr:hypothetical protein [Thermoleophilia bacterium]